MPTAVRQYIRSLDLDAYVVGGAVRDELLGIEHSDEDFLVPGVGHDELVAALRPHGRVEEMSVHGRLVGVRLYPNDRDVRKLVPKGIEITPPRAERSTGPRHKDFEIVADASITIEEDMGRRDFTVNAMAKRLATGELVDPFGGMDDLRTRRLRTITPQSFAEDPLRLLRALRLVSQLGFECADETLEQMRAEAAGIANVSGERIGGGLAADGMGELSRLLMGVRPAAALRLARDTGVLQHVVPEFRAVIGFRLDTDRQPLSLDEHVFTVVQAATDAREPLPVRLAALFHDLAKPDAAEGGHAERGAAITSRVLRRLRYPVRLRRHVTDLVRAHAFRLDRGITAVDARRFLAEHGSEGARELLALKRADLAAKNVPAAEHEALAVLVVLVSEQAGAPHRLRDLAIDGSDLIAAGFREGPELGHVLNGLLDAVIVDPALNIRETLLERARELAR